MADGRAKQKIPLWLLIIVPYMVVFLGATAAIALGAVSAGRTTVASLSHSITWKTAGEIEARTRAFLEVSHTLLGALAESGKSGIVDLDNARQLGPLLYRFAGVDPTVATVYYGNQADRTALIGRNADGTGIFAIKDEKTEGKLEFASLDASGKPGQVDRREDFVTTERPWYKAAAQLGKPGWTDLYIDVVSKSLVITPFVPV